MTGAALTIPAVLPKPSHDGEPAGFNDLRYSGPRKERGYTFVNLSSLRPSPFAYGLRTIRCEGLVRGRTGRPTCIPAKRRGHRRRSCSCANRGWSHGALRLAAATPPVPCAAAGRAYRCAPRARAVAGAFGNCSPLTRCRHRVSELCGRIEERHQPCEPPMTGLRRPSRLGGAPLKALPARAGRPPMCCRLPYA